MTIKFDSREEAHDTLRALTSMLEMSTEHKSFSDRVTAADTYHFFQLMRLSEEGCIENVAHSTLDTL